ncbi:hypothetical protein BGZ76_007080 [Entomortierella beljakovae]|nr:hypothetical protein BGZ76_007080 [Entomortierella beljakovae]
MTSTRPREGRGVRQSAGGEHDRLKRAVLQPVQCWDKKWTDSKNGKQMQVFKWVRSDRQVDFDDEDDDDEIEQVPAPRQVEETEEVGTPIPPLPTLQELQDADDTTASTPAQTGEDDDDDDDNDPPPKTSTHPLAQSYSESDRRLSAPEIASQKSTRNDKKVIQEDRDGDDEEDTDSSRPLVFTPSLETPVETQANTPQDFESMSPVPVAIDEFKREAEVEMVVKGLDEGQAEMEEEMEEVEVEKEHSHISADTIENSRDVNADNMGVSVETTDPSTLRQSSSSNAEDTSNMDVDSTIEPST